MLKLNKNSSIHKETLMEEAQIVVVEEASRLSKSMQHKLDTLWGQPNEIEQFTIFRAPCHIRESDKDLFEPLAVSIGPFHRHNRRVQAMEEKKWRFLRDFLSRGNHISLDLCISEMKLLEERTRRCYSEMVNIDSNGFVEMMLLDGCFVLEYFLKEKEGRFDSILEVGWNCVFIDSDLLLLENQIPFFVVEKLCEIGVKQENVIDLIKKSVVTRSIKRGLKCNPLIIPNPPDQIHHLVHLCYSHLVPNAGKLAVSSSTSFLLTRVFSSNRIKILLLRFFLWVLRIRFSGSTFSDFTRNVSSSVIPCATQLHDAGIKFRPKDNPQHMFDISFVDGVLEIPMLEIAGWSKTFIANLVAYEQCIHERQHLSSFASFLDSLINTEKDVMILQQCKIIKNELGSEEELTHFINQVCQGVVFNYCDDFLAELIKEVNIYCESSWNKHRARLIRDYFSSPWAAISLVAALVLLVLTFVQSFFAVYSYFVPPSS
ncbi:UPF0481 protein At3g47200-like [Carex rostrata]